jgi:D-alanyl-lipoteichoic acid acyltransferase DltB (MBOAT superfamily)
MSSSLSSDTLAAPAGMAAAIDQPRQFLSIGVDRWASGARLAAVACQLVLVALLLQTWQIDSRAFRWHYLVICAGFVVNHFLPLRWRLPFFSVLSLGVIASVMGGVNSAYLLGTGLLLIAAAHLPIPFMARIVLLVALGVTLCVLRHFGTIEAMTGVWPILGSMFMFRMIVYLYDLKTRGAPFGLWRSLAYFFMIPNVFFPLFPLVDYKTFTRTHYNRDAVDIYQKGIDWIVRGVVQLILYRFIYQYVLIDPQEVTDAGGLARYLVANFLLYLRVSGNFHLIVGVLHLFGFNLSETHHRYLLASSFTDFWRRINIYWKDFIQKVFFYPVYFRFKKKGETFAIVVATCLAFFATWALHSYQWFWLRGSFLWTWQDIAFWTILALGVLVNVVYEAKTTRRRAAGKIRPTWRGEIGRALRTIGMFVFICLLWSLWNTASLEEWTAMLATARYISASQAAWIVAGLVALGVAGITMGRSTSERTDGPPPPGGSESNGVFWRSVIKTGALAGLVVLVGRNPLWFSSTPAVADALDRLTTNRLNAQDLARLQRGYYEDLIDETRFNPELAELYLARPKRWDRVPLSRTRTDGRFPTSEIIPNLRATLEDGVVWTSNRWGMRDRDYPKEKPPGTYRIALLGDSNSMGYWVGDEQVYEYLVEERINREVGNPSPRPYEILNFSVASFGPYSRLQILPKVFEFHPDVVVCTGLNDADWMLRDVARCLNERLEIPDPFVAEIAKKVGIGSGVGTRVALHRLQPYALELVRWTYAEFAKRCRDRGVIPYAVLLPRLDDRDWEKDQLPELIRAARDGGFAEVLDLTSAFDSVDDWSALWVRRWDAHPNQRGHELIADELHAKLKPLLPPPTSAR